MYIVLHISSSDVHMASPCSAGIILWNAKNVLIIYSHPLRYNCLSNAMHMHWTEYKITQTFVRPASVDKNVTLFVGQSS